MNSSHPLISVIVPVYNVSRFLRACVRSIQKQTYYNLEILLIDDGSTDNSGKICDELAISDSRIKVIHQKNGGLSDARNTGLDNQHGKYFCFVDSDDLIEDNYIEILYKLITSGNYQLAQIGTKVVSEDNKKLLFERKIESKFKILDRTEFASGILLNKIHVAAWCNMYLSKTFKNVRFTKGKINEDFLMWADGIEVLDKVIISDECLYRYRMRKNSITHSSKFKLYKACLDNSKVWLLKVRRNFPKIIQEAEYRYLYYLRVVVGLKGYKYYQQEEANFFEKQFKDIRFLKNDFLNNGQKIYIFTLYSKKGTLIQILDKISKLRRHLKAYKI